MRAKEGDSGGAYPVRLLFEEAGGLDIKKGVGVTLGDAGREGGSIGMDLGEAFQ